jgi:hypothetical protein
MCMCMRMCMCMCMRMCMCMCMRMRMCMCMCMCMCTCMRICTQVRRVEVDKIRAHLNSGEIVLLGALGYSASGDVFNVKSEEVAWYGRCMARALVCARYMHMHTHSMCMCTVWHAHEYIPHQQQ